MSVLVFLVFLGFFVCLFFFYGRASDIRHKTETYQQPQRLRQQQTSTSWCVNWSAGGVVGCGDKASGQAASEKGQEPSRWLGCQQQRPRPVPQPFIWLHVASRGLLQSQSRAMPLVLSECGFYCSLHARFLLQ